MSRHRVSRGLIAVVGVGIVIGAVAVLHKTDKSKAGNEDASQASASTSGQPAPQAQAQEKKAAPRNTGQIALPGSAKALVTQTPGDSAAPAAPTPSQPANGTANQVAIAVQPGAQASTEVKTVRPAPAVSNADPTSSAKALADGKAQIDAGNLLAGRNALNEGLIAGQFTDADATTAKGLMTQANEVLIFSPRRFPEDPFMGTYSVQPGDRPMKIASTFSTTWDFLGRINGIKDPRRLRPGQTLKTVKGPFHAVVSKSRFIMDLYLGSPGQHGSMYVRSFPVGLGRHGSTPVGTWMLSPQGKLKDPKFWGMEDEPARESGDPLNPLGRYWMALTGTDGDALGKEGFGIHGTADPDSIGKEMSHGCIRMINENVGMVYEMLIDGKSTVITKD
ncbi:MAG TPA: L,D-transpeptidase family protein [Tepidisphaeraceae bacterium]|jgi:hypothetical protein